MTSTQMKAFLKAAECLNFTAAAEALYISQPALSRSISALEDELDLLLFLRRNNVLSLTPGGQLLYDWLRDATGAFSTVLARARRANSEHKSELRIGLVRNEMPSEKCAAAITRFSAEHRDIAVEIIHYDTSLETIRSLSEHNTDIALMIGTAVYDNPRFQYFELDHYRRCVAVSILHPFAQRSTASLREFADDTFISVLPDASPTLSAMIRRTCSSAGFYPRLVEVADIPQLISQVETNKGVALLFDHHMARYDPLLHFIELEDVFVADLTCVWDRLNTNPNIHSFIKYLGADPAAKVD